MQSAWLFSCSVDAPSVSPQETALRCLHCAAPPQAFPPKKPLFAACTAPRPHRSITALFWSNYIHTKHSGVRRSMREQDACLSNACGSTRSAQHTAAAAINSTTEPDSTSLPAVMQCVWGSLRGRT